MIRIIYVEGSTREDQNFWGPVSARILNPKVLFVPHREVQMMTFLRYLLFRHSNGITDYFSDAVRIYALRGGEDARWAALAAAKVAGKKRRRFMVDKLAQMASNVLKNFPDKLTRKQLADRLLSLKEEIESRDGGPKDAREEKEKLSKLNEEFLYCLNQADPSIFRRKFPKYF